MFTVIVEFHIQSGHAQAFLEAIVDNARRSLETEAGCRQFDVCRDPAAPSMILLYERYDDEAAFQQHLRTVHFAQMNALTAGWVERKQVRTLQRIHP